MWLWDWLHDWLVWFNLAYRNATVVFLGLDNAGKTTLINVLVDGHIRVHLPTQHPSSEEFVCADNLIIKATDMGGHREARELWTHYFKGADAVVFVVDAADPARFAEAKRELDGVLASDALAEVPVLVLANKIDRAEAVSERDMRCALGLTTGTSGETATTATGVRSIEMFMCSLVSRQGYGLAFRWLANNLKR